MSEAAIFRYPHGLFLMERIEFVILTQNDLAARIMRIVEYEMIRQKEAWQEKVAEAIEAKEPPPRERDYWVRLSHAQIIAKLYRFDSSKVGAKHPLSISKATLRKAINHLTEQGFLLSRNTPGDEFGAPQYMLNRQVIQEALDKLTQDPFKYFYLGASGDSVSSTPLQNLEGGPQKNSGGDLQNLEGGPQKNSGGDLQNLEVFKESYIELEKKQQEFPKEGVKPSNEETTLQERAPQALAHAFPDDLTAEEIALIAKIIQERRQPSPQTPGEDTSVPPTEEPSPTAGETGHKASSQREKSVKTGKNRGKRKGKGVREVIAPSPEALVILDAWDRINGRSMPRTEDQVEAAEELARIQATPDDPRNVRDRLLAQKDGFWQARGVSLKNVVNNFHLAAQGPIKSRGQVTSSSPPASANGNGSTQERKLLKRKPVDERVTVAQGAEAAV